MKKIYEKKVKIRVNRIFLIVLIDGCRFGSVFFYFSAHLIKYRDGWDVWIVAIRSVITPSFP
jgi:hypothetical protein